MGMDERKFRILQAIIDDYILTAVPVGSRTISKKYDMGLSSATIRNEMSDLEELGYLDQPHVSAGRVPSAKAYRLYVDQMLASGRIHSAKPEAVIAHLNARTHQMEDVIDQAAQVLSDLTNYTAVVLPPTKPQPIIRTLQLVPVTANSVLVVIVTDGGIVRDTVMPVNEGLDADTLYHISRSLTEQLNGHTLAEAAAMLPEIAARMRDSEHLMTSLGGFLEETEEHAQRGHVGIGGASNMLSYPEYSDAEKARSFLSLIETRDKLASIIAHKGDVAFTVRIGPETGVPEISDCSIVTATYSTRSGRQGTIGVIGPTRMQYSRVISVLGAMGQQLSQLFGTTDADGKPEASKGSDQA
jgi:heat-inducible transcriptional repressor